MFFGFKSSLALPFRNTDRQYGLIARLLHWSSVSLLVVVIYISGLFENLPSGDVREDLVRLHSSFGIVLLLIMVSRLIWRRSNLNPIHSYNIHPLQKFSALLLHRLIYIVLIVLSLFGFGILMFSGGAIYLFDFELISFMAKQESLNEFSIYVHSWVSVLIYPLFALHIFAAIYHQIFGVLDE